MRSADDTAGTRTDLPVKEKGEARGKWADYKKEREKQEEYLLVDGYNIIFAWEDLNRLSETNMAAARGKLADILCNYQGWKKCTLILVFDAYKVEGNPGEVLKYHNIYIVYTKEAETADQYIEKNSQADRPVSGCDRGDLRTGWSRSSSSARADAGCQRQACGKR